MMEKNMNLISNSKANNPKPAYQKIFERLENFLFSTHPSITDIAEQRRAKLSAILGFVLTGTNGLSLFFVGREGINANFLIQVSLTIAVFLASRLVLFSALKVVVAVLIAVFLFSVAVFTQAAFADAVSLLFSTLFFALSTARAGKATLRARLAVAKESTICFLVIFCFFRLMIVVNIITYLSD
jgi:hypothetical protein